MYGLEYPIIYILQCELWHLLAGLLFGGCFLTSIILLMGRDVRRIFRSRSALAFSLLGLAFIASLSHLLADTYGWGF
jgi:hypothetical protein